MHGTLRSELDVFHLVLIIAAGFAAVIALALITEPLYGVILGAALIVLGIGLAWRRARGSEPRVVEMADPRADGRHRILLVANDAVGGRALLKELGDRTAGRSSEILVVSPALTGSGLKRWASDVDRARAEAERRRAQSVSALEAAGLEVTGEVGDPDPIVAIESALLHFPANEVIICTHPPGRSPWLERGVVERARAEVALPVTHVVVDPELEGVAG